MNFICLFPSSVSQFFLRTRKAILLARYYYPLPGRVCVLAYEQQTKNTSNTDQQQQTTTTHSNRQHLPQIERVPCITFILKRCDLKKSKKGKYCFIHMKINSVVSVRCNMESFSICPMYASIQTLRKQSRQVTTILTK